MLYGFLVSWRYYLYHKGIKKIISTGVPTIVVGNVIAGGAGKTPLVMMLVTHLQAKGLKVGVISRGYGRTSTNCQEVHTSTSPQDSGDEPLLIKKSTNAPVFVAIKRTEAAKKLLEYYPDTQILVCDDGLQHYALKREIEIAVFDDRGTGNGWLLPAGPLREPWPKRKKQGIDLVLHTGQKPVFEGFRSKRLLASYGISKEGAQIQLSSLIGKKLVAVAAIANPDAFFGMLRSRGLTLVNTINLPDHDDFSDFRFPEKTTDTSPFVLCTEKDAVKLFQKKLAPSIKLLAVPLLFLPEPAFITAFDDLLNPLIRH